MVYATTFACPTCGAEYKVVRVEAPVTAREGRLVCTTCGGPLNAREGRFLLKYFDVHGSGRYPLRPRGRRQV
jgi:transcription elongation factor Elf1